MNINGIDFGVIIFYLFFIVGLGCWVGFRNRRKAQANSYFLAGQSLRWPVIGLALFATNISTVHLVSLAEEGYTNGLAYGNFEWMAAFALILLALFFAPFYIRSRVTTLPDFLEKRYSRASRDWLSLLSIISAIFIHIGFSLYAGAVVIEGMFGIDKMVSILIIAGLTGLYTIVGGLMAVVLTESIQTVIMVIGAIVLTAIAYFKAGGWSGISTSVDPHLFTVLRPHGDPSGIPWYSMLLGYPVIGIWYWCTDQTIVQRVLGAKDENNARIGPLFAGFIKILPVFIFVFPGLICLALINKGLLPALPLTEAGKPDAAQTYSHMIAHLLPIGLRGLVAAALMAALMSTVSGALNSVATLFTYDFYQHWAPKTSEKKLILIGRIVTFAGMVLAVLWSPLCGRFPTVFQGINTAISYLAPPITVVFVAGIFWKKASSKAAFITLVTGSITGLIVFILDFTKVLASFKTNYPAFSWLSFMLISFILAVICSIILIIFSLKYPEELTAEKKSLVWKTPFEPLKEKGLKGIGNYKLLSIVLVIKMVLLYSIFSLYPVL
ncbi:sodium:solute symporter [candidate division KSB1 bacterium]|nr:sodium:solute symporter [candidate division KSB1 bacterium]